MTRRVHLVSAAIDTSFMDWRLDLQRVVPHLVLYCTPAVRGAVAGVSLPPNIALVDFAPEERAADDLTLRQRLDCVRTAWAGSVDSDDVWCWIDWSLCYQHLSLHYLYTDLLLKTLETVEAPTTFRSPGYPAWSFFAGPGGTLEPLLRASDGEAAMQFDRAPSATDDPFRVRHWVDFHPVDEPNLYLSEPRTTAALHAIGDSHVFYCLTRPEELACRANILSVNPQRSADSRVPPLLFSHHAGGVTMHKAGRPGVLQTWARDYRVRDGDTVVWVVGEIDVRCHIMRQHEYVGRDLEEVIGTLVAGFVSAMVELQLAYPHLTQVAFAPIPPLDNPGYQSEAFPVHGTIDERIACRSRLVAALSAACREHGFLFLDIGPLVATPRGDLAWAKSDRFCHLTHGFQPEILERLYALLDAPPACR